MKLKVEVWKCPYTKKLFESFDEYQKYRADVIPQVRRYRKVNRRSIVLRKNLEEFRQTASSLKEIGDWLTYNSKDLIDIMWYGRGNLSTFKPTRLYGLEAIKWDNVVYNTGFYTNRGPNNTVAKPDQKWDRYPGIKTCIHATRYGEIGDIKYFRPGIRGIIQNIPYFIPDGSDKLKGDGDYSLNLYFYEEDWPKLVFPYKSKYTLDILTSDP